MPRAKRRCSDPGCRRFFPCAVHPRGWASSKSEPLPRDWKSKVKAVRSRSGGQCEMVEQLGPMKRRCKNRVQSVDHIINRAKGGSNELSNLQGLCKYHHDLKTKLEAQEGMKKKWGKA